jgi:hypothetical protein
VFRVGRCSATLSGLAVGAADAEQTAGSGVVDLQGCVVDPEAVVEQLFEVAPDGAAVVT